jgi:hypothetical protein
MRIGRGYNIFDKFMKRERLKHFNIMDAKTREKAIRN